VPKERKKSQEKDIDNYRGGLPGRGKASVWRQQLRSEISRERGPKINFSKDGHKKPNGSSRSKREGKEGR